jgi:hypothetical protein
MELFQKFLNKARRGYGQVDKNVFGGLLPGGAATPIGAALQGYVPPKGVKPIPDTTRRMASLVDAATGAIAGAQPFIENTIKSSPDPVQNVIASGLNALPFSVNLFGRYYTGLGDKNLEIPQSATAGIKPILENLSRARPQGIKEYESQIDNANLMLNAVRSGTFKALPGAITPSAEVLNDSLAALKSNLRRIKKGDIPFDAYRTNDNNPLTSPATSFGNLWFEPVNKGYQAKEKYDFVYGGADHTMGPFAGGIQLSPSQEMALSAVTKPEVPKGVVAGPTMNPLTHFGRAIVSKLPDKSFEYLINIR